MPTTSSCTTTRCRPSLRCAIAASSSRAHGKTKPHETIFRRMLELLGVPAGDAVMVGDTIEDDVDGATAVGMRAILVDREGRYPERASIADLRSLLALI
jgi:HAD superfamily hydrolase (TIGR01509 family)